MGADRGEVGWGGMGEGRGRAAVGRTGELRLGRGEVELFGAGHRVQRVGVRRAEISWLDRGEVGWGGGEVGQG